MKMLDVRIACMWPRTCDEANPMAASLPKTWTQTMVRASHWVGLTLPGMMLLPGSFSGRFSSPSPQRGPEANHLRKTKTGCHHMNLMHKPPQVGKIRC